MERTRRAMIRRGREVLAEVALDRAAVHVAELDARQWEEYLGMFVNKVVALGRERGVAEQDLDAFIAVVYEQGARRLIRVL